MCYPPTVAPALASQSLASRPLPEAKLTSGARTTSLLVITHPSAVPNRLVLARLRRRRRPLSLMMSPSEL
jgi:hypothetical protein